MCYLCGKLPACIYLISQHIMNQGHSWSSCFVQRCSDPSGKQLIAGNLLKQMCDRKKAMNIVYSKDRSGSFESVLLHNYVIRTCSIFN